MSVQAISWAMAQTTGSITRKAVLMSLANCHNHHTGKCCPKVATVAAELECNERTVKRALADLEEHGFIRRDRSRNGQRQGVNHYTLHMDSLSSQGDSLSITQGDTVAPQEPEEDLEPSVEANASTVDAPAKTPLQLLFDACEEHTSKAPLEKSPRAAYAKLVREMFAVGRTPEWVRRTAKAYRKRFPQCELTVAALAKWGEELDRGKAHDAFSGKPTPANYVDWLEDSLPAEENARRMRELAATVFMGTHEAALVGEGEARTTAHHGDDGAGQPSSTNASPPVPVGVRGAPSASRNQGGAPAP